MSEVEGGSMVSPWSERPEGWWRAAVAIDLPEGTVRHPSLPERIQDHLDRPSVIDLRFSGILIAFPLISLEEESASSEALGVTLGLASFLGLAASTQVEIELNPPVTVLRSM